jgi:hypothetical protein
MLRPKQSTHPSTEVSMIKRILMVAVLAAPFLATVARADEAAPAADKGAAKKPPKGAKTTTTKAAPAPKADKAPEAK